MGRKKKIVELGSDDIVSYDPDDLEDGSWGIYTSAVGREKIDWTPTGFVVGKNGNAMIYPDISTGDCHVCGKAMTAPFYLVSCPMNHNCEDSPRWAEADGKDEISSIHAECLQYLRWERDQCSFVKEECEVYSYKNKYWNLAGYWQYHSHTDAMRFFITILKSHARYEDEWPTGNDVKQSYWQGVEYAYHRKLNLAEHLAKIRKDVLRLRVPKLDWKVSK